ncbi:MAG: methyltransferase domain-containing protein [Desulfobacteraceae bacterium]|nr:MAG: methyltransferase domain-containing protein [Desulfobacteraceae bacterium]
MSDVSLTPYESWYRNGGLTTYADVFDYNDEKAIEVELIAEHLKGSLQWLKNEAIATLDIGCGTGRFTVLLLNELCMSFGLGCQSEVDLVDINSGAFDYFRETAAKVNTVDIHIRNTFQAPWRLIVLNELEPPYRLIVADHVFYGEPLSPYLIESLTTLISPDGVIIVTLQQANSDVYRMREPAGIVTNCAEGFRKLLDKTLIKYEVLDYKSHLYYDPKNNAFREWFFATATIDIKKQLHLLRKYTYKDKEGRSYILNRANIFLIRGGK